MKFFTIIKGTNSASIDELLQGFFELENKKSDIQKTLITARNKLIDFQKQSLAGKNRDLSTERIEITDLEEKLSAITSMENDLSDKILKTARKDREHKLGNLEAMIKKTRETEPLFNLEILLSKARLAVLRWLINGASMEPPSHVTPSQREIFFNEIDRVKREFGVNGKTKPLTTQRTQILNDISATQDIIIDQQYVEDFINASRPANLGVKN
jgi:hypothetical protein